MTQRQVIVRDTGHQALDELDAADIPVLSYEAAGAAASAQSAAIAAAASDATTKANAAQAAAIAASQPVDSDLTAIAALTTTSYGRAFLALADAAAARTALALGTAALSASGDFQPIDSDLTAIAALTTTSFGRGLLASADAAALRTSAGLGTLATQSGTFSGTSSGTNTGDQSLPVGGTPALTLGTANSAGSSPNFLRRDDTILAFDATTPAADGTAATGAATTAARRDHVHPLTETANFIIDGGGTAITTGIKGDIVFDFAGSIDQVTLLADQSGSIVIDLWRDTYANYPPTVADTITASAKPTLSSAAKSQDATLTGWTKAFSAGDTFRVNVDSASTVLRVTLSIKFHRT